LKEFGIDFDEMSNSLSRDIIERMQYGQSRTKAIDNLIDEEKTAFLLTESILESAMYLYGDESLLEGYEKAKASLDAIGVSSDNAFKTAKADIDVVVKNGYTPEEAVYILINGGKRLTFARIEILKTYQNEREAEKAT